MSRVAIVTDSASDLAGRSAPRRRASPSCRCSSPSASASTRPASTCRYEDFWRELTAPGAPSPRPPPRAPGAFKEAFEGLFAEGCDEIVCVNVGSKLSATMGSAKVARDDAARPRTSTSSTASRRAWAGRCSPCSPRNGRARASPARRSSPSSSGAGSTLQLYRRARDARIPQARRPDQPGPRGDRQRAVGQADHHRRGRRRRDGRQAAHARQGARPPAGAAQRHVGRSRSRSSTARPRTSRTSPTSSPRRPSSRATRSTIYLIGPSVGPHVGPGVYGAVILPKA